MIVKNTNRKKKHKQTKMGSFISKPKEKEQKREPLMAQMRKRTEVGTFSNSQ